MSARLALIVPLPFDVDPDPPGFDRRQVAEQLRAEVPGLTHSQLVALVELLAGRARAEQPPTTEPGGWAPTVVDLDPEACRRIVARHTWHHRVTVDVETGCHVWTGARNSDGYGRVKIAGRRVAAHRVAYTAAKGPIPPGMTVDHLCCRPACVNAEHLEAVEPGENSRRALASAAHVADQLARTHCVNGHELARDNLRPGPLARGWRQCATCERERHAAVGAARRLLNLHWSDYRALFGGSRTVAEQLLAGADPATLAHPDAPRHLLARLTRATPEPLPDLTGDTP